MQKTWIGAMREFFGLAGRTTTEFMREIKDLSAKERMEFSQMLTEAGIDHQPPGQYNK